MLLTKKSPTHWTKWSKIHLQSDLKVFLGYLVLFDFATEPFIIHFQDFHLEVAVCVVEAVAAVDAVDSLPAAVACVVEDAVVAVCVEEVVEPHVVVVAAAVEDVVVAVEAVAEDPSP